mmetsp:Transcript_17015/g.24717  ORF Transcript_17015/g.24717 Transcript_17015/m.24717 type:complete len:499 (+) Transcript_17015:1-1497(+)
MKLDRETKEKKRFRRLRRKNKQARQQRRMALAQAVMGGLFLIGIAAYVTSSIRQQRQDYPNQSRNHEHNHDHNHEHNPNHPRLELDVENPRPNENLTARQKLLHFGNKLIKAKFYQHSDVMEDIGDKSSAYAALRQEYDQKLPMDDIPRMKRFAQSVRKRTYGNMMAKHMDYDIHNCPLYPPTGYPYAWNVQAVLDNWAPDDTAPRPKIFQGLCTFDYETEKEKAIHYREAELPYVIRDDPSVLRTVERWAQPEYMEKLLGEKTRYRTEYSEDNHFMYWTKPKKKNRDMVPENWSPPTDMMRMPFKKWLDHANVTDESLLGPDREHWYFRLIGCGEMGRCDNDSSEYLFDELSFFQPREDNQLYMVEPKKQKGIHCRFGMKGVIAENHFDGSRNMVAILGGERRYILSHPDQCENLCLLPRGHPSARHSAVDWSDVDWEEFPRFREAEVNEVVLQAGDVMYLPTNWFHYIISLDLNFQCNTRSGISGEYMDAIHDCGF